MLRLFLAVESQGVNRRDVRLGYWGAVSVEQQRAEEFVEEGSVRIIKHCTWPFNESVGEEKRMESEQEVVLACCGLPRSKAKGV